MHVRACIHYSKGYDALKNSLACLLDMTTCKLSMLRCRCNKADLLLKQHH